ncbi:MAG TPA: CRTAC1 family protein [Vicinamibacterales bacterium]|nr:CRTAC1 family protein [Vicinamibacterales bacterium]
MLALLGGAGVAAAIPRALYAQTPPLGMRLVDVTAASGIAFRHNNGAYGGKLLPETLGSGCAFLDYDADGWQDILLVNGSDWPDHHRRRTTLGLYRNNRNGTFTDVTKAAGLDVEMYGMGVAVADTNNRGFPDIFITAVGQNRFFRNTGKGTFVDATRAAGFWGRSALSTSAMWVDYDRDGRLDLFICNYVKWSEEHDVFCSLDGRQKSYCTPEAYRGDTCWLFHNRGDGTFEDVTASSGVFDTSSKSLGVAMIDDTSDGWPDLFIANDTQPNKLYRNLRNGTFKDVALEAGVAFSQDGKARAGMGVDAGDFDNSGHAGLAVTNFENEMTALYRATRPGAYQDVAIGTGVGQASRSTLGFGCVFADMDLDGRLDLIVANGHIDETVRNIRGNVGYAQPPQLFMNAGGTFADRALAAGAGFAAPKVGRGLAVGDFDRDGDVDLLMTTNNGAAYLFRNDQLSGHRSLRLHLTGTDSNRDAIGASVRVSGNGVTQTRTVKSGSSYLSQSELPVTFGLAGRDLVDHVVITWPNGRTDDYKNVRAGAYDVVEGRGLTATRV